VGSKQGIASEAKQQSSLNLQNALTKASQMYAWFFVGFWLCACHLPLQL
jgi:hypothetical protein